MSVTFLFTSESVRAGHPDKVCDQIADRILDEALSLNPNARVALETAATSNTIVLFGEVLIDYRIDFESIVRTTLKEIGYDSWNKGFDYQTCNVLINVGTQSLEINHAVINESNKEEFIGAGDQGLMFGYATDETVERMPLTTVLSHAICEKLDTLAKKQEFSWLRPDGKAQVTVEYKHDTASQTSNVGEGACVPLRVHTVVVSTQTDPMPIDFIRKEIMENVVKAVIPSNLLDENTIYHIQPSGSFTVGGPKADAGLTGRKIIVDSYGGWGGHGGGAFSGKDSTKVDRSGAYAARWVAKSLIDSGYCRRCLVGLSYSIGVSQPLSIYVNTYGTGIIPDSKIGELVLLEFDLRPGIIIKELKLKTPFFSKTTLYGHFKGDFPWEKSKKLRKP